MDRLVSISGSYPGGNGSSIDKERLVGGAMARPALVNGSKSSVNSFGNNIMNVQSSNDVIKLVDPDDARLEALLEPDYAGGCSTKVKSSLPNSNKPLNRKSRSSENLELLLSDDFDERQNNVAKKQTGVRNSETFTERGHGDQSIVATVKTSSESLESFPGSEHRGSMNNVDSCSRDITDKKVCVLKNYRESKEATVAAKFEDPASDSESDEEFYQKLRAPLRHHQQNQKKVHPNYAGHTVRNEITVPDLPEIEEMKDLNLEDDAYMEVVGHVISVVGVLAVIKSANQSMALNEESVLFKDDKSVFGKVFEVFGPVKDPFYSVRFNSAKEIEEKSIRVGLPVYCCLSDFELTKVVFKTDLDNLKGSDASWLNDCEPPAAVLDYSDDEQEREARRRLQLQRRAQRESENEDDLQDDAEASVDSPYDSNDDEATRAAKLEKKLLRERQKYKESKAERSEKKSGNGSASKGAKSARTNAMCFDRPVTDGTETFSKRAGKRGSKGRGAQKTNVPIDVLYMQKIGGNKISKNTGGLAASNQGEERASSLQNASRRYEWPTEFAARTRPLSNPFDLEMGRDNLERPYRDKEFQFSRPFLDENLSNAARSERKFEDKQPSSNPSYRTLYSPPGASKNYTMPVAPSNYRGGFKQATFNFNSSLDSFSPRSPLQNDVSGSLFRFQGGHRSALPVAARSIFKPGWSSSSRFLVSGDRHESWIGLGTSQSADQYH